uniref:E3 ubiquitin-protein ligase synoviolin n=1 Tax=Macrostomum lignano TaxID=282301 RepID=A0A1I8GKJ5_9PLAT
MTRKSKTLDCRETLQRKRSGNSPESLRPSRDASNVDHWLNQNVEQRSTDSEENRNAFMWDQLSQVPQLLHSISLLRLIRRINWLGSIILLVYGYLYRLLASTDPTGTKYEFYDFLVDYGMSNLIIAEATILARTYFLMLRFHRVMHHVKTFNAKYRELKTYTCLFQEQKTEDKTKKSVLVHNTDFGDSNLHSEMQRALLRSDKYRSYMYENRADIPSDDD